MAASISPWLGTIRRDGARRQSADEARQLQLCQIMWALRHGALLTALTWAISSEGLQADEYVLVLLLVVQVGVHLMTRAALLAPWQVTVVDFVVLVPAAIIGLPPSLVFILGIAMLSWAATLRAPTAIASYLVVAASIGATAAGDPDVAGNFATWAFLMLGCIFMVRTIRLNMGARLTAERDKLVADRIDAILWEQLPTDGVALKVSAAAERLLGYPLARWREPGFWLTIVHPDDRSAVVQAVNGDSDQTITVRVQHLDGSWRSLDSRASWASDRSGRPAFRVGVLLDRTDQIDIERDARTFGHLVASSPVGQMLLRCDDKNRG
ncbi:MAG: PAS domain-containing protein, partial [Actinomycetota bacterium]|nr:PAS domain-containing protein [Actinomycetota bacterium]